MPTQIKNYTETSTPSADADLILQESTTGNPCRRCEIQNLFKAFIAPLSTSGSITASTTQTQGQEPLTDQINYIATCANANDTVTLPAAAAGLPVVVINRGANTLQVFPASGDDIDGGATDASDTVPTNKVVIYFSVDATSWFSMTSA